jgi:3-oxoacyl-[acyl-carrier-protein] synthase-1
MIAATVGATHVLCSIGNGTDQVWASARAGVGRITDSHVMDRHFEPIRMGLVPEDALGTLVPEIDALPLPSRARRILRLAAPSFQAVAQDLSGAVPVFLGLPNLTPDEAPWLMHVPTYLQTLTGVTVDRARSVVMPQGRAAALLALERALDVVRSDSAAAVVVGGVDSYLDLRLLGTLDAEQRGRGVIRAHWAGRPRDPGPPAARGGARRRVGDGRRPSVRDRAGQGRRPGHGAGAVAAACW